ncbi:hypothetical protein EDB86DRAFT_581871 [Lactarius hatsudake]|nr:hypothetical protein EDB86DRAFT_581871 [Lactarius hatsudake]
MIREGLDEDRNLDLIWTLVTMTESSSGYRTSLMRTTLSSAPRIASSETHLPGHLQRQVRGRPRRLIDSSPRPHIHLRYQRSLPLILAHPVLVSQNAVGTSTSLRDSTINWSEESRARKRLHELERITVAVAVMNPFTPKKRCGKKAHKATRQAAVSVSLETVVGHVQRFVQDLGSASTLSLPPTAWHSHFLHQAHESISADTTFVRHENVIATRPDVPDSTPTLAETTSSCHIHTNDPQ